MKKLTYQIAFLSIILGFIFSGVANAQATYSENFNNYLNRDSTFKFGYTYSASQIDNSNALQGRSVALGVLTNTTATFQTGYLYLTGSNTFTFQHKVNNTTSAPVARVTLVAPNGTVSSVIFTHTYTNASAVTSTINMAGYTGWYRVRFSYSGTGGSSRGFIDNFSSNIAARPNGFSTKLADVEMNITADKTTYTFADEITFFVSLKNNGPDAAERGNATVKHPNNYKIHQFTADAGLTFNQSTNTITFNNIPSGQTRNISLSTYAVESGKLNTEALFNSFNFMEDPYASNNLSTFNFLVEEAILPVVFLHFNGVSKGNEVILNWATASEINASHYEVETSVDGVNFLQVAQVKAAGNSHSRKDYSFTTTNNTATYFRLRQVDFDGAFEYTKIVNVAKQSNLTKLTVSTYPNPATEVVNFNLENSSDTQAEVRIFNTSGAEVSAPMAVNGNIISAEVNHLPTGKYFYLISLQGQTVKGNFVR